MGEAGEPTNGASRRRKRIRAPARFETGLALPRGFSSILAEAALIAGLFFCPLALGTIHVWSVGVMLGLSLLALGSFALGERSPLPLSLTGVALLGVAGWLGIQLLPLPLGLGRMLSPQAAETYAFSLQGLSSAAHWRPLTLDSPATSRELTKALAYAAAFLAASGLATSRRRRRRLAAAIAASGFAIALIGFGHKLVGVDALFGTRWLPGVQSPFITTFGNRNNAAGLLLLCAPVALGLALAAKTDRARAWLLWGPAYVFTGAAVFLTLSRGGMVGFVAGQLVLGALLWLRQADTRDRPPSAAAGLQASLRYRRTLVATLCATAVAVAVGGYLAADQVGSRLSSLTSAQHVSEEQKLQGFRQSLPLLAAFPLTGIGKGAFPTVSGRFLTFDHQTAEYIENEPLQTLVDLGLPVGASLLLLLLLAFVQAGFRGPSTMSLPQCGLWAGLFSLGVQNLVDFSLELGGVAFPAIVALALVCAVERDSEREPRGLWQLSPELALVGCAVALAVAVPALRHASRDWRRETDAFAMQTLPTAAVAQAVALAEPILERHPASFVVPLALAQRLVEARDPEQALHWINRALYFKPNEPRAHLLAALALIELRRKPQALLEARTYFEQSSSTDALALIAAHFPALADLEQAVPGTSTGLLALAEFLAAQGRPADAAVAAALGTAADPQNPEAHLRYAQLLLAAGQPAQAEIEAQTSIANDGGGPQVDGSIGGQGSGHDCRAFLALASAQATQNKLDQAEHSFDSAARCSYDRRGLIIGWIRIELAHSRPELAEAHLKLLGPAESPAARAAQFALEGDIFVAEGRSSRAEDAYRNAIRLRPGDGYDPALARSLEAQSRFDAAAQVLQEFAAKYDPDKRGAIELEIAADQQRARELDAIGRRALLLGAPLP